MEKPTWLRHEGLQIFSIDIQPAGHRFATAGADHKVRIWDMKYLSHKEVDPDQAPSKLLATLRDHFGSVNCVRWSKVRPLIASGSDDQIILVHERRAGSGTTEFGSGEPPDVENWKVLLTLRGHTADVVDLRWSPDDSLLASCSLDNTVHIWNMSNGLHVAALKGHTSLVKGVAWDPVGCFLASQSDDKTVIIWRTSDWSLAEKIEGHWEKTVGSTFFRRLDWSPCGNFITTTNGFQKPRHSAPVIERGDWTASFDFLGHNAPVVAVRFNHSLFRKQPQHAGTDSESGRTGNSSQVVLANGGLKHTANELLSPYNVIAMGSQDCSITVWTTTSARPVFVGKHFFTQSVVDLSWSPDGYSLFCCSLDGSVAAFHFEVKELGYRVSDIELEDLKKSRYGDSRGRQTTLAETPAQLLLESLAAKQWGSGENQSNDQITSVPAALQTTADPMSPHTSAADVTAGQGISMGNGVPVDVLVKESQPRLSSPVKQREYRRPDGRRRIIPESVGPQIRDERMVNGVHLAPSTTSGQKRDLNALHNSDSIPILKDGKGDKQGKGTNGTTGSYQFSTTARASTASALILEAGLCSADAAQLGLTSTQGDVVTNVDNQTGKGVLSISVYDKENDPCLPVCLEARALAFASNGSSGSSRLDMQETEIICSKGGEVQWRDRVSGKVTAMAGNSNMWALGCDDGTLQVYTNGGRRAVPCMMVGSAPAFLDCDEGWKVLLLTRQGALYMWEFIGSNCLLKESVLPLLTVSADSADKGTVKVASARISRSGAPLVVLANRHAFLFHMDMRCWQRVADDYFLASSFSSSLQGVFLSGGSELASLQAAAADVAVRNFKWNRVLSEDKSSTRAHLESQLASALALKSPEDYQHLLLAYARFLAREADEVRLRELCMELLGPPFQSELNLQGTDTGNPKIWESTILGLKKHELLKTQVLPAMASNRKIQRLLNELMDLISEHEARHHKS